MITPHPLSSGGIVARTGLRGPQAHGAQWPTKADPKLFGEYGICAAWRRKIARGQAAHAKRRTGHPAIGSVVVTSGAETTLSDTFSHPSRQPRTAARIDAMPAPMASDRRSSSRPQMPHLDW